MSLDRLQSGNRESVESPGSQPTIAESDSESSLEGVQVGGIPEQIPSRGDTACYPTLTPRRGEGPLIESDMVQGKLGAYPPDNLTHRSSAGAAVQLSTESERPRLATEQEAD